MYKGIISKQNYKFKKSLKYLKSKSISSKDKHLLDRLDTEVKNSSYHNSGPKLLKSGTNDRKAQQATPSK